MSKSILMIGLRADVVDYAKWPELTPEKLTKGLDLAVQAVKELGHEAQWCLTDRGETAEQVVRAKLQGSQYDLILVGAGVRTDPEHLVLFETIINAVLDLCPTAKMAFNTNPFDTVEAIQRWI